MESKEMALLIADAIDDKKGIDIQIIEVSTICTFADYFVIASGASDRQVKALSEEAQNRMSKKGYEIKNREGKETSGWILLDYGDVIVHVFSEEKRQHFNIEKLWSDGKHIDFESKEN